MKYIFEILGIFRNNLLQKPELAGIGNEAFDKYDYYFFAFNNPLKKGSNSGSKPASKLHDRNNNPKARPVQKEETTSDGSNQNSMDSDEKKLDKENNETEDNDQDTEDETDQSEASSSEEDDNQENEEKDKLASSIKSRLLRNPNTYLVGAIALSIIFVILFIAAIFYDPSPSVPGLRVDLCGGPSVLDTVRVVTSFPNRKDKQGVDIKEEPKWQDAWNFYDYIAAVINNEVGTGMAYAFKRVNSKTPEIVENKEFQKGIDFAYYQAQGITSVSYALNPNVGDYLNESKKLENQKKFLERCPLISEMEGLTIEEAEDLAVRYGDKPYFLCPIDWGATPDLIVVINGTEHQSACDLNMGCYHYDYPTPLLCTHFHEKSDDIKDLEDAGDLGRGISEELVGISDIINNLDESKKKNLNPVYQGHSENGKGPLLKTEELKPGETARDLIRYVYSDVEQCTLTPDVKQDETNFGTKIYLSGGCKSVYKSVDPHGKSYSGDKFEVTCENKYCIRFPDDPDCTPTRNYKVVPLRAWIQEFATVSNPGLLSPSLDEKEKESWQTKVDYTYTVIRSIKGVVMTDINGIPQNADFKGSDGWTQGACLGDSLDLYPPVAGRNNMCHAQDTSGESDRNCAYFQSAILRWPVHKILSYWYDFYFSSWSASGREDCNIIGINIEKELDIMNLNYNNMSIKYPEEETFGQLLLKYNLLPEYEGAIPYQREVLTIDPNLSQSEKDRLIKEFKEKNAEKEVDVMNQFIYGRAMLRGVGTGKSVASAAVALMEYLYFRDLKLPYKLGGHWDTYGVDPGWGTDWGSGGNDVIPYGMDCTNFTKWAQFNGGINKGDSYMSLIDEGNMVFGGEPGTLINPYARTYDTTDDVKFQRRTNLGLMGDILYHQKNPNEADAYAHAKLIVGYYFNENNVITGNVVAEESGKRTGLIFNVISVKTGKKMEYVNYSTKLVPDYNQAPYADPNGDNGPQRYTMVKYDGEYVDYCYRDPDSTHEYDSSANTDYCLVPTDPPYYIIDYSACYNGFTSYGNNTICSKQSSEEFYKDLIEDWKKE